MARKKGASEEDAPWEVSTLCCVLSPSLPYSVVISINA